MRISELSRQSGVPVATIKYYLREGVLPKGAATAATQAQYSDTHLQRLRLIRTLADLGGVPLARIRAVLDLLDNEETGLHRVLGEAMYAVQPSAVGPRDDQEWGDAVAQTDDLLEELDWRVTPIAPARDRLAQTIAAVSRLGWKIDSDLLRTYAHAARLMAREDLRRLDTGGSRAEAVERAVAMTVLLEQALVALHHLAQEDVSTRTIDTGPEEACK